MTEAHIVILKSEDGRAHWHPVTPDQVPEFLKDPDVMGRLVAGEMAQESNGLLLPDGAKPWYRAATEAEIPDLPVMAAAQAKRGRH